MSTQLSRALSDAWIDDAVLEAHHDYIAILIAATGLEAGPTTEYSEDQLRAAETAALRLVDGHEPHELPEIAVWRQAYQGFGVKPREARSSVEALLRRISTGLPRIDRLTDVYNAVSVTHLVPIGGEDLSGYLGAARLVVATGQETFDTVANGQPTVHTANPGEIVWRDDAGVTCRRWNWRQCVRTRFSDATTEALFIVDGLGPAAARRAEAAAADLIQRLALDSPAAAFTSLRLPD